MAKAQREKGATAERELARLLMNELGIPFERQLHQYQAAGGFDLEPKPGWPKVGFAIEVKRRETECLSQWWAEAHEKNPALPVLLFFRRSRQPWRALVALSVLAPAVFGQRDSFAIIDFADACTLLRESLQ